MTIGQMDKPPYGIFLAVQKQARQSLCEQDFISPRDGGDSTLLLPGWMSFALPINIHGGKRPEPDQIIRSFLKFRCTI
jgi:hypothetical protein